MYLFVAVFFLCFLNKVSDKAMMTLSRAIEVMFNCLYIPTNL